MGTQWLRNRRLSAARGAFLHWFSIRPGHVGSLSSLLVNNDVGLYGLTFANVPLDLVRVFPSHRCLVYADVFAAVVATDEAVPIPHVKPFNGSKNSSIFFSSQVPKAILHLLKLSSGITVLIRSAVIRRLLARDCVNEPTLLQVVFFEPWHSMVCSELVLH